MPERTQIYKCGHSGLTVEVLTTDDACFELSCCGEKMVLMEPQTADKTKEKHVPLISGDENGVKVVVGCTPHPMEENHYIQWIEVTNGAWVNKKFLKPGDKPEAEFYVPMQDRLTVRSYCNKHGLWKG